MTQVSLSPAHDKVVTSSADGTAIAYSLDTGDVIRVLEGHSSGLNGVAVTRKGRWAPCCCRACLRAGIAICLHPSPSSLLMLPGWSDSSFVAVWETGLGSAGMKFAGGHCVFLPSCIPETSAFPPVGADLL